MNAANTQAAEAATAQRTGKTGAGIVGKTSGAYTADPKRIGRREGWNVRFDMGEIEELAKSIRKQAEMAGGSGLLMPLRVKRAKPRDGWDFDFELVDGDRRLTACEHIMQKDPAFFEAVGVPIILVAQMQDDFVSLVQMFEANTGKPLAPLEEAAAFQRMYDHAVNVEKVKKADAYKWIAKHVGRSDIYVWETMQLLNADDSVKAALADKKIGSTTARQISIHAKGDKEKQKALVEEAKAAGKDKGKKKALKAKLEEAKRAKHANKGRQLKIRPLDPAALAILGTTLAEDVAKKLKAANKPESFDILAWIKEDDKLALAYAKGALDALKAAAGVKVNLVV